MTACRILSALLVIGLAGARVARADAPYVVLDSGRQISGVSVSVDEDGRVQLRTDKGVMTFEKGTRVVTVRPRELDQAIQHMQQRQFSQAVPLLERVARENRHLGWDREALRLLGRAHSSNSRAAASVAAYEQLFAIDPLARADADDFLRYLKGLDAAGQQDKLAGMLDGVIRTAPRAAAAWAQLRRGRLALEQGEIKAALLDVKRTADFFADQTESHPEALYLTAVCFQRLSDQRASVYRQRLKTDYPGSPYVLKSLE